MKVIDLLNKIANGEEVPEKIKFRNNIFRYTGCSYYCDEMHTTFFNIYNFSVLNEKVEIMEENKKLKHIGKSYNIRKFDDNFNVNAYDSEEMIKFIQDIYDKVEDIIDKINKLEDK